jgi:hypothetical protein
MPILLLLVLKPPRLAKTRTEMKPKNLWRTAILLHRLPPANSEDKGLEKKRKRTKDLASSSTSVPKNASKEPAAARDSELQMFELLDS